MQSARERYSAKNMKPVVTRADYNVAVKHSSSDYLFWCNGGVSGIMSSVVRPWETLFKFLTLR
jgi:hypothetical protein